MNAESRSDAKAKKPIVRKTRKALSKPAKPVVPKAAKVPSKLARPVVPKTAKAPAKPAKSQGDVFIVKGSTMIGVGLVLLAFILGDLVWHALPAAAFDQVVEKDALAPQVRAVVTVETKPTPTSDPKTELFNQVRAEVLPVEGVTLPIRWGRWLPELVRLGVIDMDKLEASFANQGGLSAEQKRLLTEGSDEFITINSQNSWFTVIALWPLGLANKVEMNEASPIAGPNVFNYASTGGWSLGQEQNGGAYFNKYALVSLTPEQETLLKELSENSYRPCCNNSTLFQDCNHGSALLGLLELGASQGLSRGELARAALTANSYWFPNNYLMTAMYFKVVKGIDWKDVKAEEVLGSQYSSASGANQVAQQVTALGVLPEGASGAQCGVR